MHGYKRDCTISIFTILCSGLVSKPTGEIQTEREKPVEDQPRSIGFDRQISERGTTPLSKVQLERRSLGTAVCRHRYNNYNNNLLYKIKWPKTDDARENPQFLTDRHQILHACSLALLDGS